MPSPTKNEGIPRKTVKMEPPSDPNENCPQNPQPSKKQQKQPPKPMAPSADVFRVKVERIFEGDASSSFNGPSTSSAPPMPGPAVPEQQIQLRNVPIQLNLNGQQFCAPDPNAFVRDDTQSDRCSDEASASGYGSPSPSPPQLQIADEMDGGEEDMEIASENGDDRNCAIGNGQSVPSDDNDFRPESAAQNAQRAEELAAEDSDHDFRHEMAEEERRTGMAPEEYAENEAATESSQNGGGGPSCSTADPLMVSINYEDGPNPDQMQLSPQELWQRQNQRQSLETLPESEKQLEAQKNGRESTNSSSPIRRVKIPLEGSDGLKDPRNGQQVQNQQLDPPMDVPLPNWAASTRATLIDNDRSAPTPARFSPPTNVNNNNNIGTELATQRDSEGTTAATKSHDDGNPALERGKQQHGSGSNFTPGCPLPLQQMPIRFQPPPAPMFGQQQQPMLGAPQMPHPQMQIHQNHNAMQQRQFYRVPMVQVPANNLMPMPNSVPPMHQFPHPPPNVSKPPPAPANVQQQPIAAPLHEHPAITAILGQPTAPSKSQHPLAEAPKKQNPASSTLQKYPNKAPPLSAAEKHQHQLPWQGGKPNPTPSANSKQLQQRKDAPESSANEQRQKEKHPSGQPKANKPVDMQLVEENKMLNAQLKQANDLLKKKEPEMVELRAYKESYNVLSEKVKTMKSPKDFNEAVEVYKKAKEEAEKKCSEKDVQLRSKQSRIEQLEGVRNDNKKLEGDLKKAKDELKVEKEKFANFRNGIAEEYMNREKEWKDKAKKNEQKIKTDLDAEWTNKMRKEGEKEKKKREELKKEVDQMKENARKDEEERGKLAEQLKTEQAKVEEANKKVEKMKKKKAKRKKETEELMERMKAEIKEEMEAKAKRELEAEQQRLAEEHRNKITEIEQKNRQEMQMMEESGDGVRELMNVLQERFRAMQNQQRINMTPSSRQSSVFPEGDVAENSQQQQFVVERPKRAMQMDGPQEESAKRRRISNSPTPSTSSAPNNHNATNSEEQQLAGSPNLPPQQNSQIVQPSADEADDDDEILIIESPSQTQASGGGGTQQHRPVSRTKSMADSDVSSRYQGLPTPNDDIAAADEENKKQQQLREKFAQELGLPIDHHQIELKMQEHFYNIQKEQMRAFEHGGRAMQNIHQQEQPEETSPPSLLPSPAIDCLPPPYNQHSAIPPSFQQQQMQTPPNFALGNGATGTAISAQNLTAGLQQQQQQFGPQPTPQQQLALIKQFLATPQGQQQQQFSSISTVPPINVQHQQQQQLHHSQFAPAFQMQQHQATPQMPPNVSTASSAPLLQLQPKKKRAPRKQMMNSSSGNGQQTPHQVQSQIPVTSRFAGNLDYLARFGINPQGTAGCQALLPNQQLQTGEMLQVHHSQMQSTSVQGSTLFGGMMAGGSGSGNSRIEQSSQSNYPAAVGNGSGGTSSSSASSSPATMSPSTEAMKMAKKMIGNFSKFFQRHPTPTSPPESLVDEFLKIVNKSPMGKKSKNLGFDLDNLVRDQLIILATRLVEACKSSSP